MRSQKLLAPVSFTLALVLSQASVVPFASAIPNPIDNGNKQAPLPTVPPTRRPPSGNRTPGGGLGEFVCPATSQKLTAITPIDVQGNTLSTSPTFWFYMPYTTDEIESGEFSVLSEDDSDRVYKTSFKLPDQPGFVSITLPDSEASRLQEGTYYHWYLQLNCAADAEAKTPLNIDGWVQRIPSTPELEDEVINQSPDIWYDSLDYLAQQLQNGSGSRQDWETLLTSVELDELTQEPVIGPVTLTEDEPLP
ncbi:DUF928 domain-containing protein [Leptolyngbya cf. ectocarpi LEGE 11479]|uniref:DUF928 domain-containing protein n=1 Tax=Leptolyngbya cf. ectocarpi LEGE 11479 TaxID=1828722 RepID=A0A928WY82_LEPEC|nr:DUF928 domain-containing protein [Leptolyngbya ectocarpi]MBE9065604.1 DUF928 domain-containing protein [Leptolyngbya cf. ectocarpi LEGE 11479]